MGAFTRNWVNKRRRDVLSRRRIGTTVVLSVVTSMRTLLSVHLGDQTDGIDQQGCKYECSL